MSRKNYWVISLFLIVAVAVWTLYSTDTGNGITEAIQDEKEPEQVLTFEYNAPDSEEPIVFPYPGLQFEIHAPHDYENGVNGKCLRDHYHTADGRALNIDAEWVEEPFLEEGCGFNGNKVTRTLTAPQIKKWEREFN